MNSFIAIVAICAVAQYALGENYFMPADHPCGFGLERVAFSFDNETGVNVYNESSTYYVNRGFLRERTVTNYTDSEPVVTEMVLRNDETWRDNSTGMSVTAYSNKDTCEVETYDYDRYKDKLHFTVMITVRIAYNQSFDEEYEGKTYLCLVRDQITTFRKYYVDKSTNRTMIIIHYGPDDKGKIIRTVHKFTYHYDEAPAIGNFVLDSDVTDKCDPKAYVAPTVDNCADPSGSTSTSSVTPSNSTVPTSDAATSKAAIAAVIMSVVVALVSLF